MTTKKTEETAQPSLLGGELSTTDMIAKAVKSYNLPDAKIAELKAAYSKLKINGPADKSTYEIMAVGLKEVTALRIAVDKKRKDLKRVALDYGNAVDGEAKRLTALLEPIESHLNAEKARIDSEIQNAKIAERKRRTDELIAAGFKFDGVMYVAGALTLHPANIDDMTAEALADYCEKGKAEKERQEAADAEAKRQDEERSAAQKKLDDERAELTRKMKELEDREKALAEKEKPATTNAGASGLGHLTSAPGGKMTTPAPGTQQLNQPASTHMVGDAPKSDDMFDEVPGPQPQISEEYAAGYHACRLQALGWVQDPAQQLTRNKLITYLQNMQADGSETNAGSGA
jgi:hypothetical protein